MLKLISWNVMRGGKRSEVQVKYLLDRQPDVLAFQEVTEKSVRYYRNTLHRSGFPYSIDSLSARDEKLANLSGARQYGVMISSKYPIEVLDNEADIPWRERLLSVIVHRPNLDFELHTTYIPPGSSNGWTKIETLEGVYCRLASNSVLPRILCGDFNTPQFETVQGEVITWGQIVASNGEVRLRRTRGLRWDTVERNVLVGLSEFDLTDVFRSINGYGAVEYSWYLKRKKGNVGRRFDHVFASKNLNAVSCQYLHYLRELGLSDHSPIEVCFRV